MTPQIPGYLLSFESIVSPPRDDHCAGPHLDGCRALARVPAVSLRDRRRVIGGVLRLGGLAPFSPPRTHSFPRPRPRPARRFSRLCSSSPSPPLLAPPGGKDPS